nr:DNA mismatch repair protein MSH5-like isoform X3 [Physcomitrium patens]|eukprot:XP_024357002.1 DNA mismatch repair protein MSH5-like isoform X3 [Physcomitrella patens]
MSFTSSRRIPNDSVCEVEEPRLDREYDSKVYMACILQGSRLGMSYFDTEANAMFVLETWEDGSEEFPSMQLIKYQAQPLVIYTSTKMDDTFVTALQKKVKEEDEPHEVKIVKSSHFSYQQARHRLAYLRVTGMEEDFNDRERMHLLNSMMNLDSEMQVRAAGGLLGILQQEMLIDDMVVEEYRISPLQIGSICELSLNGFLNVDASTHDALHIFQVDKHASSMGIGKAKEGFSLFGLLNKCLTQPGRKLLRLWFLRPILDLSVLNDRLDTVSAFRLSQDLVSALRNTLKGIKDIPRLIKKISSPSSVVTSKDWAVFTQSVSALIHIRAMFEVAVSQRHQSQISLIDLQIVKKVMSQITEDLMYVNSIVAGVIDFDQRCGDSSKTMVAYGVCEELDELKNIFEGLPDFLNQITGVELNDLKLQVGSEEAAICYIPQVGYLLKFESKMLDEYTLESRPDIQLAFEGGIEGGYFYHTSKTRELDEVIGDILHKILDMEHAILRDLERRVLIYASALRHAADVAAEIDCLVALSTVAHDQKYVRPQLSENNVLMIKAGRAYLRCRHPLQECIVNTFVPNDTNIDQSSRINIISGPNYSGKSIYAKQVALIVFLAHIGSFVPAEAAVIGLTDRHATSRSLCVIDEFGKGTLVPDGVGLLCATLHHLTTQEEKPKVLACTHFCEVFDENYLPKSQNISFYTMSVLEPDGHKNAVRGVDEIVFLYRLVPGRVVPSYGIHCAELAGVPAEILKRCVEISECTKEGRPIERLGTRRTTAMDQIYKTIADLLQKFDCEKDDLNKFLSEVFSLLAS